MGTQTGCSSVFDRVRERIPVTEAALHYGLQPNRGGMVCCPFHEDRTPSMKLYDDHFYCFGCHAHGDVTDFAARLFGLSNYDAACRLAQDFGLPSPSGEGGTRSVTDEGRRIPSAGHTELRRFGQDQEKCRRVLSAYYRLLTRWQKEYAPKDPGEAPDARYAEACQMLETVDELTEFLIVGDLEQRVKTVDALLKDGKIDALEARLAELGP